MPLVYLHIFHILLFLFRVRYTILVRPWKLNFKCYFNKKTLFFKRRLNLKLLNWRRLNYFILKKSFFKKKQYKLRYKYNHDLSFFFKKNFFKTLLHGRVFFKKFFFGCVHKRQYELTKYYAGMTRVLNLYTTTSPAIFILMRTQFFFFISDFLFFLSRGFVFVDGLAVLTKNIHLGTNSVIQLQITPNYFLYMRRVFSFFKKKLIENKKLKKIFFFKIFKNKGFYKKKKIQKFFNFFSYFHLNTPSTFEIDLVTLTLFIIKPVAYRSLENSFGGKLINPYLFRLLNFKKLN